MAGLIVELKRRNVFRVGIAYVVGSWLLVQGADLVLDLIGAAEWVLRSLAALLALGFIPAVVFAWAYELTSEGIRKEKDVDRTRSITQHTAKKLDIATMVLLLGAIGLLALDRLLPETTDPGPPPVASAQTRLAAGEAGAEPAPDAAPGHAEPNSIAVLPFSDLSPEGDQEYFSDGIAEELLNLLVRVEGLDVASRTSSFAYRDRSLNVPQIAAELKVANIVEGSVRKAGNRVRITAQLIDTRNDRHLWSDTFDRELVDIFAIQDEIATAIVTALKEQLGVQATADSIVVDAATENLDAYELYLKGRTLFIARQNLDESIRLFEQAIALDPAFARAWEGLAATEQVADDWLLDDAIDHAPKALAAATRAIELDPDLAMPYAVLGGLYLDGMPGTGVKDYTEAERLFGEALERDPNNATIWLWRGILFESVGYLDRAIADFDACLDLDPAYLNCVQHRAATLLYRGDTEAALAALLPTLYANFHSTTESFVPTLVERGDSLAALLLAQARLNAPYAPVGEWIKALEHPGADHGDGLARFDRWAAGLNRDYLADFPIVLLAFGAYERASRSRAMRFVLFAPAARAFRQSEHFQNYVRQAGIEAYWRKHGLPPSCRPRGEQDFVCE